MFSRSYRLTNTIPNQIQIRLFSIPSFRRLFFSGQNLGLLFFIHYCVNRAELLRISEKNQALLQQNLKERHPEHQVVSGNPKLPGEPIKPIGTANIVKTNGGIYYAVNNSTELKAIEISDDLYRAKFYFATDHLQEENTRDNYDAAQEKKRIVGLVSSSVYPPLPEIGHVSSSSAYIQIYGMQNYFSMSKSNREHIERKFCISEQLHPLEWILTKAKNSKILPNDLYEKIRVDLRHRIRQLQEIARENQTVYQKILDENYKEYAADPNFKPISASSDVYEFSGQVVAYLSDSYYFSEGDKAITLPLEIAGQKVRFAKIRDYSTHWRGGEHGYGMESFLQPEAVRSNQALVDSLIAKDSILGMRLATVWELEFLKLTLEFDQGELGFRNKEKDLAMLRQKIRQASKSESGNKSDSQCSSPGLTSVAIPPFIPCDSGLVDWNRESENKDKSEPPKPFRVYLIKGGSLKSRENKIDSLARSEGCSMFGTYHNKEETESAVVFSTEHDTFNLMNFHLAKEFAGTRALSDNFSNVFGNAICFGVIDMDHAPEDDFSCQCMIL